MRTDARQTRPVPVRRRESSEGIRARSSVGAESIRWRGKPARYCRAFRPLFRVAGTGSGPTARGTTAAPWAGARLGRPTDESGAVLWRAGNAVARAFGYDSETAGERR